MSQRLQGVLRSVLLVLAIGGGGVGLPFVLGGVGALVNGRDNGVTLIVLGLSLVAASIVVPLVVGRRWGRRLTAVHDPSVALPFGAEQRGSGVTLRPRAAVRIAPGLVVALMVPTLVGMHLDGVNAVAVWTVGALTVAVLLGWLWFRRYEVCLDAVGIWRRRRPRWRIAWTDLERTEVLATPKNANRLRPDDLVLHGLVARPAGRVSRSVRLRMNLLAISTTGLHRLADHFEHVPHDASSSPFHRWG